MTFFNDIDRNSSVFDGYCLVLFALLTDLVIRKGLQSVKLKNRFFCIVHFALKSFVDDRACVPLSTAVLFSVVTMKSLLLLIAR